MDLSLCPSPPPPPPPLPKQILSDNGGKLSNEDFRVIGKKLNTNIRNTATETSWLKGINEKHNAVLGSMINKLIDDTGRNLEVAVASVVASKNALANVYGFSPNQLLSGKNPNFPSNLTNKLPALKPVTSSYIVRQNLTAIHSARKAFIEAESGERMSRALGQQTHQSNNSDSVYYKRELSNQWKGPGSATGIENQTVMIITRRIVCESTPLLCYV